MLSKRHYTWTNGGNRPDPALIAATGSHTLRVENVTPEVVAKAVAALGKGDVLAMACSPYHPRPGEGDASRRWAGNDPTAGGTRYAGELAFFAARLALLVEWIGKHKVSACLLDTECFWTMPDDPRRNAAVAAKHNAMASLFRATFPDADLLWFDFGGTAPLADGTLRPSRRHNLAAERAICSPLLYAPTDLYATRAQLAAAAKPCVPWVSLGASLEWREGTTEPSFVKAQYPAANSYHMGRMLAAAGDDVRAVVLYPDAVGPEWQAHFAAYQRGWE